jgi:cob(I)alamin adenosyltransferase
MRIDRIYTRGGDEGLTSLGDGARVEKHHPRVAVLGDLDEANAAIGVALTAVEDEGVRALLSRVQNELFDLGADLCRPERPDDPRERLRVLESQVGALEAAIDECTERLEPLASFILPGGSAASAQLHLARTVVRRAERSIAALAAEASVNPAALRYVNRLSDLLFVLARRANDGGRADVLWKPGATR